MFLGSPRPSDDDLLSSPGQKVTLTIFGDPKGSKMAKNDLNKENNEIVTETIEKINMSMFWA